MIFYPEIFLRSGNTIARACNLKIEAVSDYKMGYLLLALGKVFGSTFLPKKVEKTHPTHPRQIKI